MSGDGRAWGHHRPDKRPFTVGVCRSCGDLLRPSCPRCVSCGEEAQPSDRDATAQVAVSPSVADLEAALRADRLRRQLALAPGESALVITRGPGAGSSLRLGTNLVTIGRDPTATILLYDVSVSRRHAEIYPGRGSYRLVDKGSLNGTSVNCVRAEEARLAHGDDIRIGRFQLCFVAAPRSGAPPGYRR